MSFAVAAGELVAIVGVSGAGKTTLLEAIAGVTPTTSGSVRFDGIVLRANLRKFRGVIGYVPQDDIIHADLPLQRTLRYAARLRLPSSVTAAEVDHAVRAAIDTVGLTEQVDVRVGSLSGGQRKRASIAVELLTEPRAFFLDEPTSGLDPATSGELIAHLRELADRSATVVFTTHSAEDLDLCDRIVFMAPGGRVGFVGTVAEALEHFGVRAVPELYRRLANVDTLSAKRQRTLPAACKVYDLLNFASEVATHHATESGNRAVLHHVNEGRAIRLFRGVGGTVTYLGQFTPDPARPYYLMDAQESGGGRCSEEQRVPARGATQARARW